MRKSVFALLALLLICTAAQAQNSIGLFGDDEGTVTYLEIAPYEHYDLYILAMMDMSTLTSITAAEFGIPDLPESEGYPVGDVTIEWSTSLVIGEVRYGVALAWEEPVPGPIALLGQIDIISYGGYMFNDFEVCVTPSTTSGTLALVDEEFNIHAVGGLCMVLDSATPTDDTSWSEVKSLY